LVVAVVGIVDGMVRERERENDEKGDDYLGIIEIT
jgi:hypothetical protein